MKKIICITHKDLKEGRISDPHWCPVSLAVRRQYPEVDRVDTGSSEVSAVFHHYEVKAELPKRVQDFVQQFDDGVKTLKPFRFTADFKYYSLR